MKVLIPAALVAVPSSLRDRLSDVLSALRPATLYEWHSKFRWLPLVLKNPENDVYVLWLETVNRKLSRPRPGQPRFTWYYQLPSNTDFTARRTCLDENKVGRYD